MAGGRVKRAKSSLRSRRVETDREIHGHFGSEGLCGGDEDLAPAGFDWDLASGARLCLIPPNSKEWRLKAVLVGDMQTLCYTAYMSVNVSVRLDDDLAERLRLRARAAGETLSDRLRRYAEEGARREEHPLITFRDGPTGRRAGLLGGPDVWEVAMWIDDLGVAEPDPVAALVEDSTLSRSQVDAALRYRAAYSDEITARIDLHRRETMAADEH